MKSKNNKKDKLKKSSVKESGFLKRWSRKKSENKITLEEKQEKNLVKKNLDEDDNDKSLTDEELLEKYEIQNPANLSKPNEVRKLLDNKIPDRLKQLILRRLWRLVPLYGEISELVEYGEDFTDSATVIDGMQTAYVVGKGYADKLVKKGLEKGKQVAELEHLDKKENLNIKETKNKKKSTSNFDEHKLTEKKYKEDSSKEISDKEKKEFGEETEKKIERNSYVSFQNFEKPNSKPSKMVFKKKPKI